MALLERDFQATIIRELQSRFPGCIICKMDANYKQGFPDILVLYHDKWALLELKRSSNARHQPNQDYYVNLLNEMSYANFIFPENKEDVFNDLQRTFQISRHSCSAECK